jgi:hypothetical protein
MKSLEIKTDFLRSNGLEIGKSAEDVGGRMVSAIIIIIASFIILIIHEITS